MSGLMGKIDLWTQTILSVDTGLVLRVFVTAANVGEREGGKRVLKRVNQMGKALVCTRFGSMVGLTVSHSCGG